MGVGLKELKVKKRNGRIENFHPEKIKSSVMKAGCTSGQAEKIAQEIHEWAMNQPGKIVHSFEIEKQVVSRLKDLHRDALVSFLLHAKEKMHLEKIFDKKDISQILTSLFAIIQVYVFDITFLPLQTVSLILLVSLTTCGIVLWLNVGKYEAWKHLITSSFSVSLLALIIGIILNARVEEMLLAISVGMPVAAMVDVI